MIAMISLISTIPRLSGPSVYLFWAISIQSCLAMITMPGSPYNAKDMLTSSTISSTTDQDEHTRRSSLNSQTLGIMNSSLAHNILMHGKENTESLWNYLHNKYSSSRPASVFANYQYTRHFQISGNSDPAPQIAELNTLYTRLEGNKCNVPSLICAMTLLSAIPQSWDNLATITNGHLLFVMGALIL